MRISSFLSTAATACLAGCTVGPNYAGPPRISSDSPTAQFVRAGPDTGPNAPALNQWWTALGDPILDRLEAQALAANPTVAVAEAKVRQARASLRLERANQLPSANASVAYVHARIPGVDLGGGNGSDSDDASESSTSSLDFFNLGFDASWEVDLFGGERRTVEATRANLAAAEANVADAQVSLTAEVAHSYVSLRDCQQRMALSRRSIEMQQSMLELTQQRFRQGTASALDVERLGNQVENSNTQLLLISAELDAYRNALAVLTGVAPGMVDSLIDKAMHVPLPPASVAVGDPAALLQRRPDIRVAERRLAANTARIGTAEAARFPRLSLLGIIGVGGASAVDLTKLDDFTAVGAPMLQWSFIDFGRNRARVRQAEAARDEAAAQYRGVVLAALRDAEDSLSRFRHRREAVASLARSRASADRAAVLMEQRYQAGTATLIDVLDAERQRVVAEQNLSSGAAALAQDFIALQKSLGLGWAGPGGRTARHDRLTPPVTPRRFGGG